MRRALLVLFLSGFALQAFGFSGRTLSPLRFTDDRVGGDHVSIASDGHRFLVVQADGLDTLTVYGRLITPQGTAGAPFFIGVGNFANVFWNGHSYIAILQHRDLYYNNIISAATIPRNGGGVTSVERVWLDTPPQYSTVRFAWNGRRAILYADNRFALLDPDGHPLGKPVTQGPGGYTQIIGTNDGFLANNYGHLQRISDDGVVDPKTTEHPPSFAGVLAHDGNRTVFVYPVASSQSSLGREIYMANIGTDGTAGTPVRLFKSNYYSSDPFAVALVGSRLIVASGEFHFGPYTTSIDTFAWVFDISETGQPSSTAWAVPLTSSQPDDGAHDIAQIACNAETCAFKFFLNYSGTVRFIAPAQLNSTLRPSQGELPLYISHALASQENPTLTAGTNGYLAAWNERDESGQQQAMASLIAPDDRPADGSGLALGKTPFTDPPRVAWGSGQWLVAFSNKAIRIDGQGRKIDVQAFPTGFPIGSSAMAVAWNGTSWLVIGTGANGALSSVAVHSDGTVGELHTVFTTNDYYDGYYTSESNVLAWDGNAYVCAFVVTTESWGAGSQPNQQFFTRLLVTRLSADGTPLEPAPSQVSTEVKYRSVVSIAHLPGSTLIAWNLGSDIGLIQVLAGSPLQVSGTVRIPGSCLHALVPDDRGGFALLRSRYESYVYLDAWEPGSLDVLRLTPGAIAYDEQRTSVLTDGARLACREDDCAVVFKELSPDSHNTHRAQLLFVREFKPTQPPASPRFQLVRNGDHVNVSWDLVPDALGYLVEAAGADEGFHLVDATTATTNELLLDGSVVTARVRAWNAGGVSSLQTSSPRRRATR